jgi:hypothetical protein
MATRYSTEQIAFCYRVTDGPSGVTRDTAKRIAEQLGVDETQAIHRALHELALRVLPQYEPDDGRSVQHKCGQSKKWHRRQTVLGALQPV